MPDDAKKQLLEEATIWRHNRLVYPGWLIAPEDIRDRIWSNTKNWYLFYVQHRTELTIVQKLYFLFEMNWRFEVALVPIWGDLVGDFEAVLSSINPFHISMTDLTGAITPETLRAPVLDWVPESCPAPVLDWNDLRAWWLALAIAIMRLYREERQSENFERWHGRLSGIADLQPDTRARLCYERCLFALAQMDDETVDEALLSWPTSCNDTHWQVRRAGILAEIGRVNDAVPLLEQTLAVLRRGSTAAAGNIPSLSREGWILWFNHSLRLSNIWSNWRPGRRSFDDETDREALRRRFRQLRHVGADPNELLDVLKLKLKGNGPTNDTGFSESIGFELNRRTRTSQLPRGLGEELLPAYQLMRLTEESGIPPNPGNVTLTSECLRDAAHWFQEIDSVRTQSLIFRLLNKQVRDSYLSRHRVAVLPTETIRDWRRASLHTINAALSKAGNQLRPDNFEQARARERLEASITILSRLLIRDSSEALTETWDLFKSLYRAEVVRHSPTLDSPLQSLLRNLQQISPLSLLKDIFPALAELPVPGEAGFSVWHPDLWPDPVVFVGARLVSNSVRIEKQGWTQLIARHIALLDANDAARKKHAFLRVCVFRDLELFNETEISQIARMFWAPVKNSTNSSDLPWEPWGHVVPRWALSWPAPLGASASDRVKKYILEQELGAIHGGLVQPEQFFELVKSATKKVRFSGEPSRVFIRWTRREIKLLFDKIKTWWQSHGKKQAKEKQKPHFRLFDDEPAFRAFMNALWDVMREVIIPAVPRGSSTAKSILEFVDEVRQAEVPVGAVLPALLILDPNRNNMAVSALRQEFAHQRHEYYLSALRGIVYWANVDLTHSARRPLPKPPVDLIRAVGSAVLFRRGEFEAMRLSMDASEAILRKQGSSSDRQFRQSLIVALDYLSTEAEYSPNASSNHRIPYEGIPLIREYCARLTTRLAAAGHRNDPIVNRWIEAAKADPLPEIRFAIENKVADET